MKEGTVSVSVHAELLIHSSAWHSVVSFINICSMSGWMDKNACTLLEKLRRAGKEYLPWSIYLQLCELVYLSVNIFKICF